jgi:hypothetical protein
MYAILCAQDIQTTNDLNQVSGNHGFGLAAGQCILRLIWGTSTWVTTDTMILYTMACPNANLNFEISATTNVCGIFDESFVLTWTIAN